MLEKVFNYIKEHPSCRLFDISGALKESPFAVMVATGELTGRGFITNTPPILSKENVDGVYYSAIKDSFVDDSEFCSCELFFSATRDLKSSELGYWDVCTICGKRLKDGFHYYPNFEDMEYKL